MTIDSVDPVWPYEGLYNWRVKFVWWSMTFNDFSDKLQGYKLEFKKSNGRDLLTIEELELFLSRKKSSIHNSKKSKTVKSLKGMNF